MPLYSQYSGPPGRSLQIVFGSYRVEFTERLPYLTLAMVESRHSQALTQGRQARQSNLKHRRSPHHFNVLLAATQAMFYAHMVFFKQPYHTSALTGQMWVTELLGGNPRCIKDQLGMDKHVFLKFVRKLFTMTSANHSRHVDLAEKVAIFLYTMVNASREVVIQSQSMNFHSPLAFHGSSLYVY